VERAGNYLSAWTFDDAADNFADPALNFGGSVTDTTVTAQVAFTINSTTINGTLTVDVTALVAALQTLTPTGASPVGTTIVAPSTAVITDNAGVTWGINASAVITVNGVADTTTGNVVQLYWDGTSVWQENQSKLWWKKTSAAAPWSPPAGTSVSPIP
jgi:hypothetical protein